MGSLPTKTRDMLAKLVGMLGTNSENEALVAVRFLRRKMESEGVSFGDLSNIVRDGGGGVVDRIVYRDAPQYTTRAARMTEDILNASGANYQGEKLTRDELRFLREIQLMADNGYGRELTFRQSRWLLNLYERWCTPKPPPPPPPRTRKRKPAGPVPDDMLDELGLTDRPRTRKGPMPDARGEPQEPRKPAGPVPDDVLDAVGLGETRGTYTGDEVRSRFSNLDFDDEIPF